MTPKTSANNKCFQTRDTVCLATAPIRPIPISILLLADERQTHRQPPRNIVRRNRFAKTQIKHVQKVK